MGFSRQEYWSGLPCPSLGDLSNTGIEPAYSAAPALKADSFCLATGEAHFKRIRTLVIIIISYLSNEYKIFSFISITLKVKVAQSCPTLWNPMDYTVHEILQTRLLVWVAFPSSGDLPNPGIEPRSPALQVDSLPAEPEGKPQNTGTVSLSLLQGIFLTQEWNWGLLYCRWFFTNWAIREAWVQKFPWRRKWQPIPIFLGLPWQL